MRVYRTSNVRVRMPFYSETLTPCYSHTRNPSFAHTQCVFTARISSTVIVPTVGGLTPGAMCCGFIRNISSAISGDVGTSRAAQFWLNSDHSVDQLSKQGVPHCNVPHQL